MRRSIQLEDQQELELQQDLEQAHKLYLHATATEKDTARAIYCGKLRAFADRVLERCRYIGPAASEVATNQPAVAINLWRDEPR